jgi:hypothetical protein
MNVLGVMLLTSFLYVCVCSVVYQGIAYKIGKTAVVCVLVLSTTIIIFCLMWVMAYFYLRSRCVESAEVMHEAALLRMTSFGCCC